MSTVLLLVREDHPIPECFVLQRQTTVSMTAAYQPPVHTCGTVELFTHLCIADLSYEHFKRQLKTHLPGDQGALGLFGYSCVLNTFTYLLTNLLGLPAL